MWEGSEVLAPRRRPPAGPPGNKEGIAEALSSQRATVAGIWGGDLAPEGKRAMEHSPARHGG